MPSYHLFKHKHWKCAKGHSNVKVLQTIVSKCFKTLLTNSFVWSRWSRPIPRTFKTTLSTLQIWNVQNLISYQPLTQMANPKPNALILFAYGIMYWSLDHQPRFVCFYICLFLCLLLLVVVLLIIVICLYCIDWTECYELLWEECVSNDKFQKASDTPA